MLKRENRLSKLHTKFQKRISNPLFNIAIGKNNLGVNRFAFVVSKKVDSRATVRNKARRKVRSVIEELIQAMPGGKDVAFYLKKEAVSVDRNKVKLEIEKEFKKYYK